MARVLVDDVSDPGSAEVVSFADFEATFFDRRKTHTPRIGTPPKQYSPTERPWKQTRGITLHQTACDMGERPARYDTIGAHWAVLRSGKIVRCCDDNRIIFHGHGWNNQCTSIEVVGLYSGLEDDPATLPDEALRTTWNSPSTPERDKPQTVTPAALQSTRMLIRWICINAARNGGEITVLCAHRQSSSSRQADPGQTIWRNVAVPLHAELGLSDGGIGFKIGDGYPIPHQWDPRCKGWNY